MVQIDWKKIMAMRPERMTEKDKDELYDTVAWHLPDYNTDRKHFIHFVRIAQEILKFKSEQVESLMSELDEIAAKQGVEEARERQDLIEEIDQLKEELEYHRRLGRDSGRPKFTSGEELKSEIVKLEIKNEEILLELQEKEKDLMKEKMEAENFASQVAILQREKDELKRELTALQEEALEKVNGKGISRGDSPEFGPEKQEEYTMLIRQKNKHITQLLDDIDILEKQNSALKAKLTNVCDELSDATSHINEMTIHLSQLKHINEELEKKFVESEEKNRSLQEQIEELIREKEKHDKQLDLINETLNTKVQEWKESLDAKNWEINKAEEEIKRLSAASSKHPDFINLEVNKKVAEQEQEIVNLKNELIRATQEINNCAELIESCKEKQLQMKYTDADQFQAQCIIYEEKIKHLDEKLKYAEEDAQAKAEEISEIVIQLREYEMGQFGLPEAMSRIKCLERCLAKKDLQIEKLVESFNCMEIEYENLKEQNLVLRERLGVSETEEIDTSSVKIKFQKDLEAVQSLKFQLDRRDEELIKVKLKCHKLIKLLRSKTQRPGRSISSSELVNEANQKADIMKSYAEEKAGLENKLISIIKENDALRKGMHEILESIQTQSISGSVEIQSSCLERLLEALDSRHVSGWYHPAMRLQAQLNNAEGKNEELRKQIRSFREEEKTKNHELQDAYVKIRNLEKELFVLRTPREEIKFSGRHSESEAEEIELRNNEKQSITNIEQEQKIAALEIEVQELRTSVLKAQIELETMTNQALAEKEELCSVILGLEKQISVLEGNSDVEVIQAGQLQSEISIQRRQVDFLKQLHFTQKVDNERLYREVSDREEKLLQDILRLQNDKVSYILKVEKLEKELLQSVPKSKLNDLNKELVDLKVKYQDAISMSMARYEENSLERLEEEIRLVQKEKNEILDELRIAKEKIILSKIAVLTDTNATLAQKLAASEVRELNEKQKSAHLEKTNLMLRSELEDLEAHHKELSETVVSLKEKNKPEEFSVLELSAQVNKEEECTSLQEQVDTLEKKLKLAENDRENFRELFEISQGQLRSLETGREREKARIVSLTEQVLVLQSAADEKAVIARLSHELLTCQLSLSELGQEKTDLQDQISKLLAKSLVLETKIEEARKQTFELKRKHFLQFDYLLKIISDLRIRCAGIIIFPNVESIHKMKRKLKMMQDEEKRRIKELKSEVEEYAVKKEELSIKLEGLEVLTASGDDTKKIMSWYNKATTMRLEEARSRRQNRFLLGELEQLEGYIKKMDEELISLEEAQLLKEKEWERKQELWESSQKEMFDLLQERGVEMKLTVNVADKATETFTVNDESADTMKKVVENQAETIKKYEAEIQKSKAEIKQLKSDLSEKSFISEDIPGTEETKKLVNEDIVVRDVDEQAEKTVLKVTVQSLQSIIQQKEDTIYKYQELLKEGRDEYSKSFGKFREEIRMLQEALAKQGKAYSKLKSSFENGYHLKSGLPKIMEKYLMKIHELEDDLTDAQMTVTSVNGQIFNLEQEKEKWRSLAEERQSILDQTRQRMESDYKTELEHCRSEIENYQLEIERLKRYIETVHLEGSGDNNKITKDVEMQEKLLSEDESPKDNATDWPEGSKSKYSAKEIKSLERQLKFAKDESARLRDQLRLLQAQKSRRPKPASSVTSRSGSDSKSSLTQEGLQSKLKTLEELLKIAKEREHDLIEGSQRRIKSAEEVARWGEKKKAQQTIQNLNSKLKEKEAEIEILKNKNESFRNMIHKFERDMSSIEVQLKTAKGGASGLTGKLEKLMNENSQLQKEIDELKSMQEAQQRHESGIGAAILHDKLESQERKIAVLELASKGRSAVVDEFEKLKNAYSILEKRNLKLESENLDLHIKMEKEKSTVKRLTEKNGELEKMLIVADETRQQGSDRTLSSLTEKTAKISEVRSSFRSVQSARLSQEKSKKEYVKLKDDYKALRAKYLEVIDRNHELEEEIKKYQYHIHLLEEKDLADSISKTNNLQLASRLSQELLVVKAQLNHKSHLLNRVKILLTKAAAKEKALNEKVSALDKILPGTAAAAGEGVVDLN